MASSSSSIDMEEFMEEEQSSERGRQRSGRGKERGGRSGSRSRGRGSRGRGSAGRGRVSGSRGRGGRGRGSRSRSTGREQSLGRSDKERIEELWRQRKLQMKEVIRDVDTDKLRSLVLALIDREPGLVFDLCENADLPNSQGPTPPVPLGGNAPSWCRCGHCREMGTDVENKCCGCLPRNCVSTRDEMERLVLDPQVLSLGQTYFREMLGRQRQRVESINKMMRHSAYRNFILWRHGRLGAGVRRVIPSCCVLEIRGRYPNPTGTYTGFIPGRFI